MGHDLPGFSSIWLAGFWEDYEALAIANANNFRLDDNHRFEASVASFIYPTGSQRFPAGGRLAYVPVRKLPKKTPLVSSYRQSFPSPSHGSTD